MTSQLKPCKKCGSETAVTTLGSFGGTEGPVAVTVEGMPAVVCTQNHKWFLYAEFASMLMDFVADPQRTAPQPPAVKRGLVRKHYHCSGCEAELPADSTKTSTRSLEVTFRKAAPFKVVVATELYECERCGRQQVRSNDELADNALKAVAHGFRTVDIHPER